MKQRLMILFSTICFLVGSVPSMSQGRVVINEFMAWSGCTTTSEFVELLNFGPGPMNIGCYTISNGQYSITIPPNTILQPGEYYVLAGQDILLEDCGNQDSSVVVDLNWNTCNCTNAPIPITGDGFLQNGGNANEKIILLDPNLNVVDAVSRNNIPSSSITLTTSNIGGVCLSNTFNLNTMPISYESINSSTGIDNSFARKVDGDCGWVKTTAISAHAPNKTDGSASVNYSFSTLSASECTGTTGTISIQVSTSDVASLFPMLYTLAFDIDSNGVFDNYDQYTHGVDSSSPSIDIRGLPYGRYRITVASAAGCNLKTFNFFIFNCYGIVLPLKLTSFVYAGDAENKHMFHYSISEPSNLKELQLQRLVDGTFRAVTIEKGPLQQNRGMLQTPLSFASLYRLKLEDKLGNTTFSPTVRVKGHSSQNTLWFNQFSSKLYFDLTGTRTSPISIKIFDSGGTLVFRKMHYINPQSTMYIIDINGLKNGVYYGVIHDEKGNTITSGVFLY